MVDLTHIHSYAPDEYNCPTCGRHTYEVKTDKASWSITSHWMFRSWSGPRRIDGIDFSGPVYYLGTHELAHDPSTH